MKLRAFITIDEKPLCSVYEVWVYDLTDPDRPRKLPDRLGTYPSQFYAERARRNFDVHRLEIELEQEYA
jgi:hypothetical protein